MRETVMTFDSVVAKLIGKLPKKLHSWFHALGVVTMPIVWSGVIALLVFTGVLSGDRLYESLLVIILIPLGALMKRVAKRDRPPTIYAEAMKIKTHSFPSSHAYASMVALGYLGIIAFGSGMQALATILLIGIVVIGVSRVHLGAHYPSDVVGGWVLGALALMLVWLVV